MDIKQKNANIPFNPYLILMGGIIGVSTGAIFARLADAPSLVTAAYRVGLAALILIPLAAWKTREELSQILGHSSYNWALKWFSTGFVAVSLLGEPIGSTILAYIIFNEGLTWLKIVGGMFILSAIYIAASGEKK